MDKPLFKIIDKVKGSGQGYWYAVTEPEHPNAMTLKDHKRKYIYLHRVVMENHLGRLIDPKTEEVHHKDENKANNNISNLELSINNEQQGDHAKKNKFWKKSPRTKERVSSLNVVSKFLSSQI